MTHHAHITTTPGSVPLPQMSLAIKMFCCNARRATRSRYPRTVVGFLDHSPRKSRRLRILSFYTDTLPYVMKFAVAFFAVLAVASPLYALELPASGSGALAKELQYLVDLEPFDKLVPILMSYAANERDVHAALKILQSNEFKLFVQDVETIPEVKNLLKYIQEAGLDISTLINKLTDILDLDHISPLEAYTDAETIPELKNLLKYVQEAGVDKITLQNRLNDYLELEHISPLKDFGDKKCGGFCRLAIAHRNLVPVWKYEQRSQEMFKNSTVFSDFVRECRKLELRNIYLSFRSNKHYVQLVQEAEQAGIFSAGCRKYYPLLMVAKIVLTLAL